jgi:hypothetical protein
MQQMNFLLQILLLAQHVSGTFMPIIRSSRVLYRWLLPVVFGAWFSSCRYSVELRVVCPQQAPNTISFIFRLRELKLVSQRANQSLEFSSRSTTSITHKFFILPTQLMHAFCLHLRTGSNFGL